ncbi:MAG: M56 family metallopeptidase, partial [Gemmatimonadales bacterium]
MSSTVFIYVLLFTVLVAVAAAAIEWGAQGRIATRKLWTVAIALAVIGPVGVLAWHEAIQSAAPVPAAAVGASRVLTRIAVSADDAKQPSIWNRAAESFAAAATHASEWFASLPGWSRQAAVVAAILWVLLSLTLAGWLVGGSYYWHRARRGWHSETLDGVDIDVSPSTGPAVLGLMSHRIVLPVWATAMQDEYRRLILAHECEHISARDPERLALAIITLVIMPWNIALWWCAARLRRAIELDCDARVLRRYPDAKRYGYVLLEVAARGRNSGPLAMPMVSLLRLPSELEGRLRAMSRAKTLGYRSTLCGAVVALVAVSAAFVAPVPSLSVDRGFADAVPVMTRPQRGPAIVDHAVGSAVNRAVDRVI